MRASLLLLGCLALAALPFAPVRAFADDDEPAAPGAPAAGPLTISQDWKKGIKHKNAAHAKERGAFWAEKVKPADKDIFWLGLIWDKANEREKAIACFEAYLKLEGGKDTNRESSLVKIMELQGELQMWDKAVAAGQEVLKLYPGSRGSAGTWAVLGRIQRRKGDLAAAEKCFREALALKRATALFDLVDLYMLAGDANKAKAAFNEFREIFVKDALKANADMLEAFVGRIGTAAPSLEGGTSLGLDLVEPAPGGEMGGEAPAAPAPAAPSKAYGGKPTLLYHVHHGAMLLDLRMRKLKRLRDEVGDRAQFLGLASLKKFDINTQKEDPAITPEREQGLIEAFLEKHGAGLHTVLLNDATFQALGLRWAGQMILVDSEGKLRWMRLNDENIDDYDWFCAAEALKKFGG